MKTLQMGLVVNTDSAMKNLARVDKTVDKMGNTFIKMGAQIKNTFSTIGNKSVKGFNLSFSSLTSKLTAGHKAFLLVTSSVIAMAMAFKLMAKSLKAFTEYETMLLRIQSFSGESRESVDKFSDSLRGLGKTTIFTAKEVGNASSILSKMGIGLDEQLKTLSASAQLASATQEGLGDTVTSVQKQLNAFGLSSKNAGWVVETMGKAVTNTALDMKGLNVGLQYVSATADSVGLSLTDVSTDLGLFADKGIKASRSGRLLKNIYRELGDESSKASKYLRAQGYDVTSVKDKMALLRDNTDGAIDVTKMFSSDTASMALVLKDTTDKANKLAKAFNDPNGVVDGMAKIQQMGNTQAWMIFKSLWADITITIGKFLDPLLKVVVQGGRLNKWINKSNETMGGFSETMRVVGIAFQGVLGDSEALNNVLLGLGDVVDILIESFNGLVKVLAMSAVGASGVVDIIITGFTGIIHTMVTGAEEMFLWLRNNTFAMIKGLVLLADEGGKKIMNGLNPWSNKKSMGWGDIWSNAFAEVETVTDDTFKKTSTIAGIYLDDMTTRFKKMTSAWADIITGVGKAKIEIVKPDNKELTHQELVEKFGFGKGEKVITIPIQAKVMPITKKINRNSVDDAWAEMGPTLFERLWGESEDGNANEAQVASLTSSVVSWGNHFMGLSMDIANTVFDKRNSARQREIEATKKHLAEDLSSRKMSNKAREIEEKRNASKVEAMQKDAFNKKKKQEKANTLVNIASGIAGAWSSAMQLPYPVNIVVGASNSAMMTAIGAVEMASINSQQFADGGVVGGFGGATGGTDNRTVGAREGEMFINAPQQKNLHDAISDGSLGGSKIEIVINGDVTRDKLTELEDNLNVLLTSGRVAV